MKQTRTICSGKYDGVGAGPIFHIYLCALKFYVELTFCRINSYEPFLLLSFMETVYLKCIFVRLRIFSLTLIRVMGDVNPSWQSEGTNYTADFTTKSISEARRTRCRPTSGGRKNNPQPLHLAHLRRIHNQVSHNDVVLIG